MNLNMTDAFEQIKVKSRDTFAVYLDRIYQYCKSAKEKKESREDIEDLMENLRKARNDWITANINYEFAKEEELIDYYAYLIKASQIKYDYLIKKIKEKGAKVSIDDSCSITIDEKQDLYNN